MKFSYQKEKKARKLSSSRTGHISIFCEQSSTGGLIINDGAALQVIRELHVKNLALIQDIAIEFESGFSIFTGETGAGKSILIGAIGLLLGDRASTESVRAGAEEAEICGVFDLPGAAGPLADLLHESTIAVPENELIIRRKISVHGKNRIYMNQVPVPLALLKIIGNLLIDFHSQHEHQSLLLPETAPAIIDSLPGVTGAKSEYTDAYSRYSAAKSALEEHERKAAALKERRDILEYQFNELNSLELKPDEEHELETELQLISSSTERIQLAGEILDLLGSDSGSIAKSIAAIRKKLQSMSRFDQSTAQWLDDIDNAQRILSELETYCESYGDTVQSAADPRRMEFINDRIARIQRLKKKYSCSSSGLIDRAHALKADLDSLENSDAEWSSLARRLETAEKEARDKGARLSGIRKKTARQFDKRITAQMNTLGFKDGEWETECARIGQLT
ncbi:MAG: AAA family ATPase, partial [Chitinivibrionales bacterium]|nr:AAA family ATPase [Chitinivibrionales bacterium]